MTAWGWFARLLSVVERAADMAKARDYLARMKEAGEGVHLGAGIHIEHPEYLELGARVFLNEHCWISSVPPGAGASPPRLVIGPGAYIGRFATIACVRRVTIGPHALVSDRVFIGDSLHGFSRVDRPIAQQPLVSPGPVEIGEHSWIGIGACILPNVRIGRHCVIGANAVVTRDVPDFHVAAGVPARVLRRVDVHESPADRLS